MAGISDYLPSDATVNLTPPRRPGLSDLLFDQKIDRLDPPPAAGMACAAEYNNFAATIGALSNTGTQLELSVAFSAGAPVLVSFAAQTKNVENATFVVARHAGGAGSGDIDITWPASTFPVPTTKPKISINGTTPGESCIDFIANGIRVITHAGGAAADLPFTISLN